MSAARCDSCGKFTRDYTIIQHPPLVHGDAPDEHLIGACCAETTEGEYDA